ncbi:Metallo-beta-lactamase domain-containing protein [Colletotrichum higginsianum IMI 349063]|uniref:Metallo-beta-lactamase domain-containing protein n=1 Tax=Colletotrichum higginsianum (strain IMI 349063) TaxID=759273 RepID=A0A1B7YB37_COLHI|nr:Metallo-beta-lactamase domain-containing protein [Colletotrichum higginsianum IMI 349063]OBR09174.1 Metallo-beta-lactamase domain-containing protein [Colletotrichum higginsianum IMI 349063]
MPRRVAPDYALYVETFSASEDVVHTRGTIKTKRADFHTPAEILIPLTHRFSGLFNFTSSTTYSD